MKRRQWLFLLLFVFLNTPSATAQSDKTLVFTFEPELNYTFGETQYELYWVTDPGSTGVTGIRSLLEFPVNAFSVGATTRLVQGAESRHPLGLALTLATKLNDPAGKFKDGDWLLLGSGSQFKFSYTESKQKMALFLLNFEASIGFPSARRISFDMFGGFRYQRITQDIFGYSGWVWTTEPVLVEGTEHALYYKVTYSSPYLGFRFKSGSPNHTLFHLQAAISPTYMKDFDDHLLRFKSSTSAGWGEGVLAQTGLRFSLKKEGRGAPYFEIAGRFTYLHGSPTETQTWYGDDPATVEDDTGLSISNIPHSITLTQLSLGARLGFAL
jgi:hypothetical protein